MNDVISALVILTGLGLIFGSILALSYKKLKVFEDPRIDTVEDLLPKANCGACGVPGCRAFAEKVVTGELNVAKCTVSPESSINSIADYLGTEISIVEKRIARLLCYGGLMETGHVASYEGGVMSCRGEALVNGGGKSCTWGCLGLADCVKACDFEAMFMNDNGLPVVIAKNCTACGDCVDACPKNLLELMPQSQRLIVQCKSLLEGDEAETICAAACTACKRCVADGAPGLISIQNNLAVIDYEKNDLSGQEAIKRCPTKAIVWLETEEQFPEVLVDTENKWVEYYQ